MSGALLEPDDEKEIYGDSTCHFGTAGASRPIRFGEICAQTPEVIHRQLANQLFPLLTIPSRSERHGALGVRAGFVGLLCVLVKLGE